ncbi:MAG: DEAD/DEAH box helicase family protein, partial [Actinomycetota bacterium]|nr:DEAD/DEAH box helicase family protein [Actinomycetota bacterium]
MDSGGGVDGRLAAEQRARVRIDAQLAAAGWLVQDRSTLNLFCGQGVAVREVVMAPGHGRVDYLLYVDKRVCGVIEAKPEGTALSGVEWQSAMYATGLPEQHRKRAVEVDGRLPFVFEATGSETHLTNGLDPTPRARRFAGFPQPTTLARWLRDWDARPDAATWRGRVQQLPPVPGIADGMRPAQVVAIEGIERSLREGRHDRSLVQMATGAGKTYTAVAECYRLLRHGGVRRILFLVDRTNLGEQTRGEFEGFVAPDDGRKFTELYPTAMLTSAGMLASTTVVISTIQRVHAALSGRTVTEDDDPDLDRFVPDRPVEVAYSPDLPPESFDLVIVDECHRSIYGVWRGVLENFDAHLLGLTATPVKQTFAFFRQNLVSEYTYAESVVDGVNVDFDVYRIATDITAHGATVEAGSVVPVMDRRTRRQRYETLESDLTYGGGALDRAVTSPPQVRLVLETFRDRLRSEIFPGRTEVPKTLIFCKDDNHAEHVVTTAREVFGRGNDFAVKITYAAKQPRELLKAFRTSPTMRIAVTVDMIATGTDIKPLE